MAESVLQPIVYAEVRRETQSEWNHSLDRDPEVEEGERERTECMHACLYHFLLITDM